jgi:hypothetical protein
VRLPHEDRCDFLLDGHRVIVERQLTTERTVVNETAWARRSPLGWQAATSVRLLASLPPRHGVELLSRLGERLARGRPAQRLDVVLRRSLPSTRRRRKEEVHAMTAIFAPFFSVV